MAPVSRSAGLDVAPETIASALSRIIDHARRTPRPFLSSDTRDQWLRMLLDALPTPVYATDVDGFLTYFNQAAASFAGRTPRLGIDRWCVTERILMPDGTPLAHADCPMATAIRENRSIRGVEAVAERPDGTRVPFTPYPTPIHDADGRLVGAVNVLVDISARKRAEQEAAHLATHDALTGLLNRASFIAEIQALLAAAGGRLRPFAVMKLDVIGFRHINGAYGHAAGDEFLCAVARRLNDAAQGCVLARVGADKFGLIVPDASDRAHLRALAERLRHAARAGPHSEVAIAAGCAIHPDDGGDETTLLGNAASALREAKRGADPVAFFDAEADLAARDRLALQAELRQATASGALALDYQPQFGRDGAVRAFEVLVRWRHPVRGIIAPGSFIPLAEEDGTIIAISEWILLAACREAARWSNPLVVAVNISPTHFRSGELTRCVRSVLAETGLEPDRLEIEITEGVMVDDFARAMNVLQELRGLGVRVALDDFGTGYSSLSYLQAFPLTKLKIDRSFTCNLGRVQQSAPIVRAVVQLGHALGLEVAAEGIESAEQLKFLLAEGCDLIQGYFTGRPAAIETYRALTGREPEARGLRSA